MFDHVSIQVADLAASAAFYDAVLAPLGGRAFVRLDDSVGYGTDRPTFWIGRQSSTQPNKEVHLAFTAADRDTVVAFRQAAVGRGPRSCTNPGCSPSTTPTTSVPSCAIPMATTSRPSATNRAEARSLAGPTPAVEAARDAAVR